MKHPNRLMQKFTDRCAHVTLERVIVGIALWAAGCFVLAGIYQGAFTP